MKETIKARLKAKYSGVNLSKQRLDAIADKIAGKVATDADEAAIDAALDVMNDYYSFADIAKDDDKLRTAEANAKKPKEEKPDPAKPDPAKPAEDVPEWAKTIIEQNKTLSETVTALQKEKTTQTIKEKLKTNPKLKDIPESVYAKWNLPEKDEDIEAFADEVATFATEHGIGAQKDETPAFPAPGRGEQKPGKQAPQKEIEAITDGLMNITSKN